MQSLEAAEYSGYVKETCVPSITQWRRRISRMLFLLKQKRAAYVPSPYRERTWRLSKFSEVLHNVVADVSRPSNYHIDGLSTNPCLHTIFEQGL